MSEYLPQRAVLRNGETVLIREIGPDDRRLLAAGFDKLSKQSRYFRFLAPHKELSNAELDKFTETNTDAHFAIGAASVGVDQDMPLGTARFVRRLCGNSFDCCPDGHFRRSPSFWRRTFNLAVLMDLVGVQGDISHILTFRCYIEGE
jgi:hypothetical protein